MRGIASRAPVRSPETVIGSYDIVFARGRYALEALAVGTAVVLCDKEGAGPMVDSSSFDALRLRNFGCATLGLMPSAEVLLDQINRYHANGLIRQYDYKWCGPARLPGRPQAGMLRGPVVRRVLNSLGKLVGLKRHG